MKIISTLLLLVLCSFAIAQNTGVTDASSLTPYSLFHIHKNAASGQILQLTNTTSGNGSASTGLTLDLETNFNAALKNNWNNSAAGFTFWTYNGSLTEKLRIANSGNIGIGTTSPQALLDVNGEFRTTYNTSILPASASNGGLSVSWNRTSGSAEVNFYNLYNNAVMSYCFSQKTGAVSATDLMMILGNGKVGIGIIPTQMLDVNGSIKTEAGNIISGQRSNFLLALQGDRNMVLYDDGVAIWHSGTNISDIRLKKDIKELEGVLPKVIGLRSVSFHWKDSIMGSQLELGVIAQEVENVFPELVYTGKTGIKNKLVEYPKLSVILLGAIKEQQKIIDSLKMEIGSLQEKNRNTKVEIEKQQAINFKQQIVNNELKGQIEKIIGIISEVEKVKYVQKSE